MPSFNEQEELSFFPTNMLERELSRRRQLEEERKTQSSLNPSPSPIGVWRVLGKKYGGMWKEVGLFQGHIIDIMVSWSDLYDHFTFRPVDTVVKIGSPKIRPTKPLSLFVEGLPVSPLMMSTGTTHTSWLNSDPTEVNFEAKVGGVLNNCVVVDIKEGSNPEYVRCEEVAKKMAKGIDCEKYLHDLYGKPKDQNVGCMAPLEWADAKVVRGFRKFVQVKNCCNCGKDHISEVLLDPCDGTHYFLCCGSRVFINNWEDELLMEDIPIYISKCCVCGEDHDSTVYVDIEGNRFVFCGGHKITVKNILCEEDGESL